MRFRDMAAEMTEQEIGQLSTLFCQIIYILLMITTNVTKRLYVMGMYCINTVN